MGRKPALPSPLGRNSRQRRVIESIAGWSGGRGGDEVEVTGECTSPPWCLCHIRSTEPTSRHARSADEASRSCKHVVVAQPSAYAGVWSSVGFVPYRFAAAAGDILIVGTPLFGLKVRIQIVRGVVMRTDKDQWPLQRPLASATHFLN